MARVNAALQDTQFQGKLHHFTTIDSTNLQALRDAQAGAEAGQVYIADQQTAGRGRGGHTWHSEPDGGLYLTVLVRPPLRSGDVLKLSMMTGLAAMQAVADVTGSRIIDLRWPNDLVIGKNPARKVGGILTEAVSTPAGELRHAAIGIGVNLNQIAFPPELLETATSLRLELGHTIDREQLAVALLRQVHHELHRLAPSNSGRSQVESILTRFEQESTWACGKQVQVAEDEGYTGVTDGLTPEGLLRVRCGDGRVRSVRHGGVREL